MDWRVNSENHVAEAAAGFVLAGGRSSRMGRDKAFVEFEGRLLVERAIAILKGAALPVHMAGVRLESASRLEAYAPVVPDEAAGKGPLAEYRHQWIRIPGDRNYNARDLEREVYGRRVGHGHFDSADFNCDESGETSLQRSG